MILKRFSSDLIQIALSEIKKNNNIEKIQVQVIEPILQYSFSKLYPYILITSILFFLFFLVGLVILFLLIKVLSIEKT